ncbi:MAG: alcohol dehydrogenase catalytic domain-containing protein [Deinococcales bacterium]|jgi:L-iditol 2-dehydrogenase
MRAAAIYGAGDVRVEERARPCVEGDGLLLRMRSVGICGSDLHYYREGRIGQATIDTPMIPGHEIAAEVVDERAPDYGFEVGEVVAVDPALPCGRCESCRQGFPNLCAHTKFMGSPEWDGALREYLVAPPTMLQRVPASFHDDEVALLEPLGVAIHALDLARVRPLATVGVVGAGPIGLLLIQVARICGAAEVHVAEPLPHRRDAALDAGADSVHTGHEGISEVTGGRGTDVVLEATDAPDGLMAAVRTARIGGKVIGVGIPEGDDITLTASVARNKGLSLKFSHRMGDVYGRAIRLVEDQRVRLMPLVSHRFHLNTAAEAFASLARHEDKALKAVVHT